MLPSILAYLDIGPFCLGSLSSLEQLRRDDWLMVIYAFKKLTPGFDNRDTTVFLVGQDHIDGTLTPGAFSGGRQNSIRLQCSLDLKNAHPTQVHRKNPANDSDLKRICILT